MNNFHRISRRMLGKLLGAGMLAALGPARSALALPSPSDAKDVDLTIYHIEMRRSYRVIWLCEELGIPYKLIYKRGDIMGSMNLIKEVSPLMPMAPTINFKGQIMVEYGGILELLLAHYGDGRLVPPKDSPDFVYHLQFMHWAEGTGMDRLSINLARTMQAGQKPGTEMPQQFGVGPRSVVTFMEDHLSKHSYFGGRDFTAADIMVHFVARASGPLAGIDADDFPHIKAWRRKIWARPAFKRAIDVALPGGHDEDGNVGYGLPIPFANPPAVYERPKG